MPVFLDFFLALFYLFPIRFISVLCSLFRLFFLLYSLFLLDRWLLSRRLDFVLLRVIFECDLTDLINLLLLRLRILLLPLFLFQSSLFQGLELSSFWNSSALVIRLWGGLVEAHGDVDGGDVDATILVQILFVMILTLIMIVIDTAALV